MTQAPTTRFSARPALWGAAVFLTLALGLWWLTRPGAPPQLGSPAGAEAIQQEFAALQAEMAEEREARLMLASEVEFMRQVLLEMGEELQLGGPQAQSDGELSELSELDELTLLASPDDESAHSELEAGDAREVGETKAGEGPIFELDQLIAAGIDLLEAERVRDIWHEAELAKLELRDRATREGWAKSDRFNRKLNRIRRESIDDLGECGYDSLLYGTGKNNRVVVRDVLEGSTASLAGLQPGDVVMRYNDKRVFAGSDLQKATSRGTKGETIIVDVERGGETIYMNLERGPIGVFIRMARGPPSGC